jgi:putative tryptophan/tyrosine transport system substrate-binding protein
LVFDLMRRQVSVIAVPGSTPAAMAAKGETTKIPILFVIAADPVQVGLVASLNRPGGNLTGVVTLNVEIAPKRLELPHELFPTATSFALLVNPTYPALAEPLMRGVQAEAYSRGEVAERAGTSTAAPTLRTAFPAPTRTSAAR